jgi:tight adherence protein B
MIIFLIITVFFAATFSALAIYALLRGLFVGKISQLITDMTNDKRSRPAVNPVKIIREGHLSQIPFLDRWLQKLDVSERFQNLITQANLSLTVGQLMLLMLISGVMGSLLSHQFGFTILIIPGFLLFGSLPLVYIFYCRKKRLKLFMQQFPDALDMMVSTLRAGHAFGRALQMVATEAPDPIAMEFRKTFEEQNLGLPMKEALVNLTHRIGSVDLKLFVTAVLIQRESGGNLTEILTKISQTIRARFKLVGQIKVFTTQGRFSGFIIGSLPMGLGFIISWLNPDYIMLLFRDPLGQYMIAAALTLQIIGFFVIRKIVRIKIE